MFVHEGGGREAVPSMPGVQRQSIAALVDAAGVAGELGIPARRPLSGGAPRRGRRQTAEEALNPDNLCNRAVRAIKTGGAGYRHHLRRRARSLHQPRP